VRNHAIENIRIIDIKKSGSLKDPDFLLIIIIPEPLQQPALLHLFLQTCLK